MYRSLPAAALLCLVGVTPLALTSSLAQTTVQRAEPADAAASVPSVVHRPAFADYRGYVDQEVGSWKETNDTAGRIGGWRVYAREAREPQPGTPADTTKPASGSSGGHAGHGAH